MPFCEILRVKSLQSTEIGDIVCHVSNCPFKASGARVYDVTQRVRVENIPITIFTTVREIVEPQNNCVQSNAQV